MVSKRWENRRPRAGVHRQVRGAYWIALSLVAMLATASYVLLGGIIQSNHDDGRLLDLAGRQQMLSQRIVALTDEVRDARTQWMRETAVKRMNGAIAEFKDNYREITGLGPGEYDPAKFARSTTLSAGARDIIENAPYNVGYYTDQLISLATRFLANMPATVDGELTPSRSAARSTAAVLTGETAEDVLRGYSQLSKRFALEAANRVSYTAEMHTIVFFMMIGLLGLEALFIFRPMSSLIERRTRALVEAHNDMAHAAAHDALTGLNNRTFLTQHFEGMIDAAHEVDGRLAVVQIDLDEFKQVNDTLGHAAGDIVLKTTAERIRQGSRDSDICARLGGDEFVIVLPAIGDQDDLGLVASKILSSVNQPIEIDGTVVHVGASAGIAVFPDDAVSANDLMVHSDLALYCAKRDGRGTFRYFSESMRARLDERRQLESDMRDAIAGDIFDVHFQPQVSLKTGAVTGVEALLRWNHPERGFISPATFLPIAEKSGLICEIGRIAIRKAIMQAAVWQRTGHDFGRIAVNVSGIELADPGFVDFIFATLRAAKLPPSRLSIEVLETVVVDDRESGLLEKLSILRKSGIQVELDDFGTGYATLTHINSNAVDRLKIDRQFITNLNADAKNAKIVRAITELARSIDLDIIAEGAETQEELDCLAELGCYDVQGYSIAFPMPANEASDWLHSHAGKTVPAMEDMQKSA